MADLAAFLTGPTAREALARRDISAVFGILRDAGVTQSRIATATGQRQSEVSEIVSGRQVQSVAVLERIADGLGVPRGWLGLAYTSDTTSPEPPPLKAPPKPPDPAAALLDEDFAERVIKAELLDHGITVLFGKPDAEPAAPTGITTVPTPVPRRVGPAELAQVTAVTERLGRLLGDLGGIPVTDALTAHTTTSEALLDATMRDPVRQQLLLALSDAHRIAGIAACGAGLRDLARAHFSRSMECAGAGDDRPRAVLNLAYLGRLELRVEPSEALKFFRLGVATAPSRLTQAMLEYDCSRPPSCGAASCASGWPPPGR
jgi:transcriptional regulator with XRE-family HTH domain